jgi:hypothetical protein
MSSASGFVTALLAAACVSCATVQVTYDPLETFDHYRSWDWLPVSADERNSVDPELEGLVRASVEKQLAARGYRRASWLAPDFYVACQIELIRSIEVHTETNAPQMIFSMNQSPSYIVSDIERRARVFERATVSVDVSDAANLRTVWRGVETKRVRRSFRPHAGDVVKEILDHFPSRGHSALGMMARAEDEE